MKPVRKLAWTAIIVITLFLAVAIGFWARPLSYFNELTYIQMSLSGAHSRYVSVAGHRLHYYEAGPSDGRPVVLVHGLGGRCEDWRNLVPYLVHGGFHVFTPDLPGYGRSERPNDFSYSVPDEAATVLGFMDALGLHEVDLGGWSMGGWIVQVLAVQHSDRVVRLMLFDSAGLYEKPVWDTGLFTPATAVELDRLDALLMPHPPQVPAFIMADILRVSHQHAWVIHRALNSMLTGRDATDSLLPQLKLPVLIVWGAEDQITPLAQAKKIHSLIPQSQFEVIPACGHLAPVQCADIIGPKVESFLK